jgi:hypothetical protein
MSQAQRAVIALFACLVIWLAWQSRMSWQHPILPSGEYPHQQSATYATGGENQAQNLNWNNWTRDPVAVFTGVLTGFNGLLFFSTLGLWLVNRQSAKIAERALVDLEAPFINVKITKPGLEIQGNGVTFGTLRWCVTNYGRTPATIIEIFDDIRAVPIGTGWPPAIDLATAHTNPMPYGVIAPPNGQTEDFPYLAIADLIGEVHKSEMPLSKLMPFFIGYVRYADIFKNRYILGFCYLFDRNGNRWILAGGDEYNYCRKERGPTP